VEFELGRNIDVALQEVQTRIAQAARRLPTRLDPAVITKTNPEDQPILWLMLTSDGTMPIHEQMIYARNTLKDQFSTLSGVGSVVFGGYVDPNLRVWLSLKKLNGYQLTATDVITAIQNEQMEVPAGRIENEKKEFNIRLLGEAGVPTDFGKIRISQRGGGPNYNPIFLNQVAKVEEGVADLRAISRFNGKTTVGLGIVKQRGSNAVRVSENVKQKMAIVRQALPKGLSLDVQLDSTKFIKESVSELNFTLLLSAILTSIVCFLFLGSWSSTLNVLFAIPTSIVGAFLALYFYGFTLNTFTLLGLSLAIGIVVDDAIMMLENIVRHAEMGKNRRQAALDGSKEITFAAIAATIAIGAIFVPVIFMKGIIGRFFYQYGITVTVAVLLSLLEALTLTPMRCSEFLQTTHGTRANWLVRKMDVLMESMASGYRKALAVALHRKGIVVFGSVTFFILTLFIAKPLRKELIPAQDQSLFLITMKTPVGTSVIATDNTFKQAESYLAKVAEVLNYYTSIGNYQGSDIVNVGVIYITLKEAKDRKLTQREVMDKVRKDLRAALPGTEVFAQDLSLSGFTSSRGYPIEFTVQGTDWQKLAAYSQEIIKRLRESNLVTDINTDYQVGMPEIQITPDRDKAAARGVSVASMGQAVSTLIGGQIFDSSTQYPKDGHRYDIRVRSEADEHNSPDDINNIFVRNNRGSSGELVPLHSVTQVKEEKALQIISRLNRERSIPIYANVAVGKS
jgi:HAE1 family hydrophobic/amphiphilic exporter-1